jgi:capsular exopolysaccharide synthesis family protein
MPSLRDRGTKAGLHDAGHRNEVFRVLRSNLLVALSELERPTVIVTSAAAEEGKTATCANLAVSLAATGLRVIVVDVDFRHPNLHLWLGGQNDVGLSDVLRDHTALDRALQFVELGSRDRGLYLLPTGPSVNNPTELLGGARMAKLLTSLASQADVLLLDTPPVLPVADTLVLGRMAAGAILVVEARRTPITAVQQAKDALTRNQTRLLGIVLNKMQARDLPSAGYGYGYGYGYGTGGADPDDDEYTPRSNRSRSRTTARSLESPSASDDLD